MQKKTMASGIVFLAVLIGLGFAIANWNGDYSDDPEVAVVEKERDREFADPDDMTDKQMREAGDRLKKMAEGLNDEQKKKLWESSASIFVPMMMSREEKKWDEFLALPPDEQKKKMDERIDKQLAREADQDNEQKNKRPQFSAAQADEFWKKMNDWTTPEQRAKFETIMSMYNDRREQRGLEPFRWGRN